MACKGKRTQWAPAGPPPLTAFISSAAFKWLSETCSLERNYVLSVYLTEYSGNDQNYFKLINQVIVLLL